MNTICLIGAFAISSGFENCIPKYNTRSNLRFWQWHNVWMGFRPPLHIFYVGSHQLSLRGFWYLLRPQYPMKNPLTAFSLLLLKFISWFCRVLDGPSINILDCLSQRSSNKSLCCSLFICFVSIQLTYWYEILRVVCSSKSFLSSLPI